MITAVAPDDVHAEIRRGTGVRGVGRLEGDGLRRQAEGVERVMVYPRMGLEDADRVHRQDGVEGVGKPRAVNQRLQHRWRWSNGQTEGQITKLKLVKRQMYGRGKLDLLQARVLGVR